jgi:hypothetical protein
VRYAEHDRGCKPSTIRGYRNTIQIHLLPACGEMAIEDITVRDIERRRAGMSRVRSTRELSNKTKNNCLVLMHAVFRRAVKLYLRPPGQPSGGGRPIPGPEQRRHPGVLRGGDLVTRPRGRLGDGRGDLPDRRVHRASTR